jgi:hypothetical protein
MAGVIDGNFVFNIEKRFRVIFDNSYAQLLSSRTTWWPKLVKETNIDGLSLRLLWLLNTAGMSQVTANDGGEAGGSIDFDELVQVQQEMFPAMHRRGMKISKLRYQNALNGGSDPIAKWVGDEGSFCVWYTQKLAAITILNGDNINTFDNVPFFSGVHPNHALQGASSGTYANDFTSGKGPGACPIDDTVDILTALTNLSKALAYIAGAISQPDGETPRNLRPKFIMHPPRMTARVQQLLHMTFSPQMAGSAAASTDAVQNIFEYYGLGEPVECPEFDSHRTFNFVGPTGSNASVTGNDTTYYIVCEEANESELGALHMVNRQPFTFHTYSGEGSADGLDAVLGRSQDLEYHVDGVKSVNPGLPYTIFRCKGA